MKNVKAVILAAGEGTRMKSRLSKLLHPLRYQALVKFPVNACVESGIGEVILVVGHQAEKIKSVLGDGFTYVYQKKRLGTGDALKQAVPLLKDFKGELVVLPGDAPFINSSTLIQLIQYHRRQKPVATVLTRQIKKIVESKDAKSEELKVKEVNSGIYCFDTQKLLQVLPYLNCNNVGKEYYLTDVVELFHRQGLRVEAMMTNDPTVVLGVNTPEELKRAWRILKKRDRRKADNPSRTLPG